MKFLNLGCPQKLYKTCKSLRYSCFLCDCKYDIIKLNTGAIPFSKKIVKEEKKLATKEKIPSKNTSANINSREMLQIEYHAKIALDVNLSKN